MDLGDDRTERVLLIGLLCLHAHDPPVRLASGQVEPPDRPAPDAEVGLAIALLARADDDVAGVRGDGLEPLERLVVGRT